MVAFDETRNRILDAAAARIEAGGEGAVRLRDLADEVQLSEPSLYHYFRNRDELIVQAHVHRFKQNLAVTVDPIVEELSRCTSPEHFTRTILELYRVSFGVARFGARATRLQVVGAAFRRPELREAVVAAMREALAPAIEVIAAAQAQGWLRSDMSAEVFAYWNLGNISSLAFVELNGDEELLDSYQKLAVLAIKAVMNGLPAPSGHRPSDGVSDTMRP